MRCGLCKYWDCTKPMGGDCILRLSLDDRFGLAYCRYGTEYKQKQFDKMMNDNKITQKELVIIRDNGEKLEILKRHS